MAAPLAAAGITAGAGLVSGLIEARQRKKQREMEARAKVGEAVEKQGERSSSAIQDIIKNLRASLGR